MSFASFLSKPIANQVVIKNRCNKWMMFKGISAITTEQREYSKWVKWAVYISLITLAVILIMWAISQFVFK